MAYSAGPQRRGPPQWGYNEPASPYATQEHGYRSGSEAYLEDGGRGSRQRGPQRGPDYSSPEQYDGYNMNPWSQEANGHQNNYSSRDNSQSGWHSNSRPPRNLPPQGRFQDAGGHSDHRSQGQPGRPPLHDQFSQESVPSLYDNDGGFGNAQDRRPDPNAGYGNSPHQANAMPYRDRPQQKVPTHSHEDDHLPRYMNGHANRFSNDSGRQNGRHDYREGETSAHVGPVHGLPPQKRQSFENMGRTITGNTVRPQTADGFRRNDLHGNPRNPDRRDFPGDHYGYEHEPASPPPIPVNHSYNRMPEDQGRSGYDRNQPMESATGSPHTDSGLIPVESSGFQDPGAVSGFYGAPDRRNEAGRPNGLARAHTEDPKWKNGNVAQPVHASEGRAHNLPMESRAEIFDASHEDYRQGYGRPPDKHNLPVEDEMPNFDSAPRVVNRGQGMTVDDHLQPQPGYARGAQVLPQNEYDDLPPPSPFRAGEIPRSRSQPDFSGPQRSNAARGEDYGMTAPRPVPYDRPATSASSRDRGATPPRGPQAHPPRSVGPGGSSHGPAGPGAPPSRGAYGPRDPYGVPPRHGDQRYNGGDPHRGPSPRHQGPAGQYRGPPPNSRGPPPGRGPGSDPRIQQPDRFRDLSSRDARPPTDGHPPNLGPRASPPGGTSPSHKPRHPSLDKALPNPDALPSHPVPIRPGLTGSPQATQNVRPPPVRQYNASSPEPYQNDRADSGSSERKVSPQELEHLRQRTLKNPNDSATQFQLAKKLAEAADVLVDSRADPATQKRVRDRYQADSIKIIKRLSALSYADADFFYADCYSRGAMGLQCDIKEAFLLYQKAAKANHAQAAYRVAVCCELGQEDGGGTKRDAVKAMQWYRRAATLGDVAAKYKMGVILLKGLLGQSKNPLEGLNWLKQAAEVADKENPHSLHELALLHEKPSGLDGIRQDEAYSRSLFVQAANLGYKFSQYRLGCAYEYGALGCMVDPRQSIAWYSKAAVQEEHQSELALSGWYLTGAEGILQQSDTEAYLWARKAAQAGLAKAEYAMGYYTEVGIGAPANLEDAKRWYWKSASQNFPKARDRLEDLRRGGGPKQKTRVSRTNMRKQSDGECVVM